MGPAATFSMAGLLGFGGPKRLVLTFWRWRRSARRACATSSTSPWSRLYVAVSTVLVSVPVVVVIIAGERAAEVLARGQTWLAEHATLLRVWLSLGLGVALVVDAFLGALL